MVDVVVVGSLNQDLTVVTERLPVPGETLLGSNHYVGPGGKGANQAAAAARQGGDVAMVGRVGGDHQGRYLIASLGDAGVDTTHVTVDPETPTGVALIALDRNAENAIIVSPGANLKLGPEEVNSASSVIASAGAVLAQLEVPIEAVFAAAELATGPFILNPAPARELPRELLERVDVLVPNRSELAALTGVESPATLDAVVGAARRIESDSAIIVTLGKEGSVVIADDEVTPITSPSVDVVDTVGAGDAFCGALALALARGETLVDASRRATVSGALATTKRGAQSLPRAAEVEALLRR